MRITYQESESHIVIEAADGAEKTTVTMFRKRVTPMSPEFALREFVRMFNEAEAAKEAALVAEKAKDEAEAAPEIAPEGEPEADEVS